MSNYLAIATVTATLNELLRPSVESEVTGTLMSTMRPNNPVLDSSEPPGVNTFLYQVTPNSAYRNDDLPTRRADGTVVERPQVALDLHYLLTFYGDEDTLEPQRLLGSVVRTLHVRPLLTRQAIEDTVGNVGSFPYLAGSNLADQFESVKFTQTSLNLEELSKLWSVFFQATYKLSVAYVGSLVLIEADDNPQQALPVRERNIYVRPFRHPVVEEIETSAGSNNPIFSSSTLIIQGKRLRGDVTALRIGEAEYTLSGANLGDTRIEIDLSSAVPTTGALMAGMQALQVIHRILMGTPPIEHEGVESNAMPLLIRPTIRQTVLPAYDIVLSPLQIDFRTVTVTLDPEVGARQRVVLILNEFGNTTDPAGFSFLADTRSAAGNNVIFTIPDDVLNAGDFIVRVQVDGAQSIPERDLDEFLDPPTNTIPNPTFNQYDGPRLTLP
ncbi:MAG: DUF4255 domain-containing protein [Candidatus Scalindua rubra]|uniref:Pvc16 N-terminal domain-containing protein n=1 Tax=Candidatus Scalindua brodae TaxID=237368 RepID=A0A0B0ERX7_9BACT|nr:MAG: hypothetical protein SCABRO_00851 [Candidatus Scalindua brodae]MBZ0108135.1 DUF4255 domain-containing protein [Candidatus Scalindua rubra]TWU31247.1 hypothetical protein S225a_21930 [Candidatus Brocadiaceae bacterium S225]